MPLIRELQDVLRPTRKKGQSVSIADILSPHGTATGLGDTLEQTRLCDQVSLRPPSLGDSIFRSIFRSI